MTDNLNAPDSCAWNLMFYVHGKRQKACECACRGFSQTFYDNYCKPAEWHNSGSALRHYIRTAPELGEESSLCRRELSYNGIMVKKYWYTGIMIYIYNDLVIYWQTDILLGVFAQLSLPVTCPRVHTTCTNNYCKYGDNNSRTEQCPYSL